MISCSLFFNACMWWQREESDGNLDAALVFNAGGGSRRMGRNKALLPVPPGNLPLLAYLVKKLAPLMPEQTLVVYNEPDLPKSSGLANEVIFVADKWGSNGPLGGILTALEQCRGWILVLACDLPFVSIDVIQLLWSVAEQQGENCDVVLPRVEGRVQPMYALYHVRCYPYLEEALEAGVRRVQDAINQVRVCIVDETELRRVDPELLSFTNVNTPQEWEAARARLAEMA
jgi:molybdopterin-guanine dinucleotide biosynthesis protein A